jgi:flagellar motor switch protein FliN
MTEAAAPARQAEPAEFLQMWSDSFSQVMGQIKGSAIPCAVRAEAPADLTSPAEGDFWAGVACSGALRGEMILRLAGASAVQLAQSFMSEPIVPNASLSDHYREAVIELLRQISGLVCSAGKAHWGEFQLRIEPAAAAPSWSSAGTFWLQIGEDGPAALAIEFGLSVALAAELRAEKSEVMKTEFGKGEFAKTAPATGGETAAANSSTHPAIEPGQGTGALDLLMDVQLALTLRFGASRLLLREVLDFSPGAVIELDRKVQEPVDLLLDGRVVARGEVVVIDGSYGLRVTDASPLGAG